MGETRDLWNNVVNPVRKMRAKGGKTNSAWAMESFLEEVTFAKHKHSRWGRGSKLLVEKPDGGRPAGCPRQRAELVDWCGCMAGCGGQREGQAGPDVKDPECHGKELRLHLKQWRAFSFCHLALPLLSSLFLSLSPSGS